MNNIFSKYGYRTLLSALKFDIVFQARHGFYHVYLIISILYILVLSMIPDGYKEVAGIFIIFSDPLMLGFIFIGAIVLMEKEQDVYSGLFITPYRLYQYFISKIISLTLLSVLSSLLIIFFSVKLDERIYLVLAGIVLSSILFTLLGFFLVAKVQSLNEYILKMPLYIIFLILPIVELLGIFRSPIIYIFPTKAVFLLIGSLFNEITPIDLIYSFINLLFWIVVIYSLASHRFKKYILQDCG